MIEKSLGDLLIKEYESGISGNQISIKYGINISSLMRYLRKNNVKTRSVMEGVDLHYDEIGRNKIEMSEELDEIISGNLLGDGCVRLGKSKIRNQYNHVDKHLEYVLWLKEVLMTNNIESSIFKTKQKSACYQLQTLNYNIFKKYRERFYPNNSRIVPSDIKLTPIIHHLLSWPWCWK